MLFDRAKRDRSAGVSEVIGTLVLIGVVVLGIAIVGIFLSSNPLPTKVPSFNSIISNQSQVIYLLHKGGDALQAGEFQILVDGGDQTANFSFLSSGTYPWSIGETLIGVAPAMPGRVVIVMNGTGGGATILANQLLVGSMILPMDPNAGAGSGGSWYFGGNPGCNWLYRKKITIHAAQVTGDQVNFPILVSLTDADLSAKTLASGNDIIFTSSDGSTQLPHEIENFTQSSGYLVAWVGVPTLSSSSETVLYMYYGNSTATSQENAAGVWDDDFMGVWHHDTDFLDSSGNGNTGSNTGSVDAVGQVAHGRNYVSNDYVEMPASASIN
ncbi:MAG: DUF2341 domain-containing protein, partial [Methanomicrobiales archaeon]|nr:DUF2341 domain-containing protein [Methanomicrobiales archaeon]